MAAVLVPEFSLVMDSPVGWLGIRLRGGAVTALQFLEGEWRALPPRTVQAERVADGLRAYFADPGVRPDVELETSGTGFQKRVWRALMEIPPGAVLRYGDLAAALQSSPRAVGGACRANPVPIIVPCHRVVAARGIGGYAGRTGGRLPAVKRWLLAHERGERPAPLPAAHARPSLPS